MMRAAELIFHELFSYMVKRDSQTAHQEWIEFCELYSDERRHYHDLDHIEEMVVLLYTSWITNYYYGLDGSGPRPRELVEREKWTAILAAFYHDCFAPWEPDAEVRSAQIMQAFVRGWSAYDCNVDVPRNLIIEDAYKAICATATHESEDYISQLVIDADLARFCTGPWRRWAGQIREEYSMHSDEVFNKGRKDVLEHFLYRTPFYYRIGNGQVAQNNIVAQLRALKQETDKSSQPDDSDA